MMVTVKCPSCGTSLKIREGFAKQRKEFKCLRCGSLIPISAAPSPPPSALSASTRHIAVRPIVPGGAEPTPASPPAASSAPPPAPPPAPATPAPAGEAAAAMLNVVCSGCKRTIILRTEMAGKKVRCKQCGAVTLVRADADRAAEAAPASSKPADAPPPGPPPATIALPPAAVLPPSAASAPPASSAAGRSADASEASAEAALRRRAEQAELALRQLAGQHAVEKAELLHEIETLKQRVAKAEESAARCAAADPAAVARKLEAWAAEHRRQIEEHLAQLRSCVDSA